MTIPERLKADHTYVREERLGILCENRPPTPEQLAIAQKEADEWALAQMEWEAKEQMKFGL